MTGASCVLGASQQEQYELLDNRTVLDEFTWSDIEDMITPTFIEETAASHVSKRSHRFRVDGRRGVSEGLQISEEPSPAACVVLSDAS